jgi:hypothetical protein
LDTGIRRLLLLQAICLAGTSAVFLAIFEIFSAVSVWYGGGIAATNGLLQARCLRRDQQALQRSPQQSLAAAVVCMVQRFAAVALLFSLGLAVLDLDALAMVTGFIVGQIVLVVSGTIQLKQK